MIQWLLKHEFSLQDTNKFVTCVMYAALCRQVDAVIWMLSNGSSISENTRKTTSCECAEKKRNVSNSLSYLQIKIVKKMKEYS